MIKYLCNFRKITLTSTYRMDRKGIEAQVREIS